MTWVPCHGQVPIRYLVCLNRLDSVAEMRREVSALVYGNNKPDDKEIILAEVFDNHISKILVSNDFDQVFFVIATNPTITPYQPSFSCLAPIVK